MTNFGPIELGNWRYPTEEEIALCNGEPLNLVRLTAFDSGVQNYKWQPGVFTFAATGTVYLANMPAGLQSVSLDWTLQECDGVANVASWKVAVDDVNTDRWRMQVSQAGDISVCRVGFRMIIR